MARSTGYTAANPPGIRSAATAPLVSTPCRSSSVRASACARTVWAPSPAEGSSRSGSRDHRPLTVGGPIRVGIAGRPKPYRRPGPPGRGRGTAARGAAAARRCPEPPSATRSGASVSLVSSPAQTRSQIAAATSLSSAGERPCEPASSPATRSLSIRKNSAPPPLSTSSTASCSGVMLTSPGSGSITAAPSAGASTSQPSPPGSAPGQDQRLQRGRGHRRSGQPLDDLQDRPRVGPPPPAAPQAGPWPAICGRNPVPGGQEPGQDLRRDRFHLLAQPGQAAPAQQAQ